MTRRFAAYSKVIEARPKFPYAYFDRGLVYEMKGEKASAIADYKRCLELDPGFPSALQGLNRLGGGPARAEPISGSQTERPVEDPAIQRARVVCEDNARVCLTVGEVLKDCSGCP